MRGLIFAALLFCGAHEAAALEPIAVTIDSVSSTTTTRGVSISSQTAFNVIISTSFLYRQVCVQNLDTAAFLACSENVNVSTITSSNQIGTIIPSAPTATTPAQPICFSVVAGNSYYCLTSSTTGTTRAGITRGR